MLEFRVETKRESHNFNFKTEETVTVIETETVVKIFDLPVLKLDWERTEKKRRFRNS